MKKTINELKIKSNKEKTFKEKVAGGLATIILGCMLGAALSSIIIDDSDAVKIQHDESNNKTEYFGYDITDLDGHGPYRPSNDVANTYYYYVNDNVDVIDYSISYYHTHFKRNATNEIHYIINTQHNTISCIHPLGSIIEVRMYEHEEGTERDAKKIGSGMLYSKHHVNIETGDITKIK